MKINRRQLFRDFDCMTVAAIAAGMSEGLRNDGSSGSTRACKGGASAAIRVISA